MPKNKPWFENDRFWEISSPFLFSERKMEMATEEIDQILKMLEVDPDAKILDLCCGPGRHSIEMAGRGYSITGVDRNTQYLTVAKDKAASEGLNIEFIQKDMRKFRRDESFDAVINIFTSFGYFDSPEDESTVLDNIYASLKPGGKLMMDMIGKEILTRIYTPSDWSEKDGVFLLTSHKPIDNWTYMENHRIRIDGDKIEKFSFTIRLYSANELTAILNKAGFDKINIYGSLDGIAYDNKAQRLVAVASK